MVSDSFRTVSDGFGLFSHRFGSFSDRFGTVFGLLRTVLDDFDALSDRFRMTPLKILKFQISIGRGWGPSVPFRPSVPFPPSRGQLKFEILRNN